MDDPIHPIAQLWDDLEQARPAVRRDGERIASEAVIEFSSGDDESAVSVGATPTSGKRTVRFTPGDDSILWTCTCRKDASPWCKHVVAAVVAAYRRGA